MHKKENTKIAVQGQGGALPALETQNRRKPKILFFHNTLPEYRIGWFQNLSELAEVEFVFTNVLLNKRNYGFNIEYERVKELRCTFLPEGKEGIQQLKNVLAKVAEFDFVELPPIDSIREVVYGTYIVWECKKYHVKIGYFWEKWDAPKEVQPLKRRIKNLILRIIPRVVYSNSNVFFAVGQKSKEYFISNGIAEKKIEVIPDVSETPPCQYFDIREQYGIPADRKVIMYLGRTMPQKGVRYLIEAFCGLDRQTKDDCHLMIAGDGEDLEECKKIAMEYGMGNITFAGAVDPGIRGNYFSQCDIFVYPVTYYGGWVDVWGLTLNEAVQHGKIVIATDAVGSAYELIEDGVNGYRVEPENILALTEALQKALEPRMAQTAAVKDAELMKEFCFREMAERYISSVQRTIR